MKGRKNILRIGTLLAILMFLLIFSVTPKVYADPPKYTAYGSTADTVFDTTESADAICPSNQMENYSGVGNVDFKVDYTFKNNHASKGSYHRAVLSITRTQPSLDNFQTDTGWIFVPPQNSDSGALTLSDYIASTGYSYTIYVDCYVKETIDDPTPTTDSDNYTWSV